MSDSTKPEVPEVIDLGNHATRNTMLSWCICNLVSGPDKDYLKVFPDREAVVQAKVVLTVNGVQLPLEKSLERMWDQFDDLVKKRASKLLDEKVSCLNDVLEQAKRKIREDLNLPIDEEW